MFVIRQMEAPKKKISTPVMQRPLFLVQGKMIGLGQKSILEPLRSKPV